MALQPADLTADLLTPDEHRCVQQTEQDADTELRRRRRAAPFAVLRSLRPWPTVPEWVRPATAREIERAQLRGRVEHHEREAAQARAALKKRPGGKPDS